MIEDKSNEFERRRVFPDKRHAVLPLRFTEVIL
jgi:hypothetical protein